MTQDQHDPVAQAPGSTESTSAASADAGATAKVASSRPQRRRHTTNRSRQAKETQDANEAKTTKATKPTKPTKDAKGTQGALEQQGAQEPAAIAEAPVATETAAAETEPPAALAAETSKRSTTRGRRGGSNRRRNGKAEVPDIQLVPVTSATEPTEAAGPTEGENPPETPLPVPELLPLDAAIFAHLDALSQAEVRKAAEEGTPAPTAEEQPAATAEVATPAPRRYRFDRQRGSATAETAAVRPERLSGWRATPPTLMTPAPATPESAPEPAPVDEAVVQAEPVAEAEAVEAPEAAETPDVIDAPATEEPAVATEVAPDEADQSDHEAASRRRRRRGRRGHGQEVEAGDGESEGDEHQSPPASRLPAPYAAPETRVTYARDHEAGNGYQPTTEGYEESGYSPYTPAVRGRGSRSVTPSRSTAPSAPTTPSAPAARNPEATWSMSTAQQHVQESASPFESPEPSFAHGFGPQSSGVAGPLHEPLPRIRRGERSGDVPMSANQLGTIITSAITQQTDRLLSELRRQQYPPSMTVALPAFPSTERIGVFVDVANLLYSARSQRMNIDFGRLLDFLRANRRLIRAHAYAPTNPDPHAEQSFLSAVKGVGYRITTKNYKTFASGARKADMDLDLCMDIVRLVDADAIDTVVLVSGDSDFLPLLEYCSDHGVRVEVAAFDDAAAMILRQSCDLFINLSQVDEIRA
ncbi:MAG TPA: NYN domain-containing protein [Ktedonobacterales bacterium]|jgi:uncharacterized LabA/DUF88 family protein